MPRRLRLTLLLPLVALSGGCGDSYRFEDNYDANASVDAAPPIAVDRSTRDSNSQECDDECQADGQSSSGG